MQATGWKGVLEGVVVDVIRGLEKGDLSLSATVAAWAAETVKPEWERLMGVSGLSRSLTATFDVEANLISAHSGGSLQHSLGAPLPPRV